MAPYGHGHLDVVFALERLFVAEILAREALGGLLLITEVELACVLVLRCALNRNKFAASERITLVGRARLVVIANDGC